MKNQMALRIILHAVAIILGVIAAIFAEVGIIKLTFLLSSFFMVADLIVMFMQDKK